LEMGRHFRGVVERSGRAPITTLYAGKIKNEGLQDRVARKAIIVNSISPEEKFGHVVHALN